jgi:Mycothiol maleylpyruvate isomerase N-terminal domain
MDLWQAEVEDLPQPLTEERADLLRLLGQLTPRQWTRRTAVPGWTVKDLALHLLDDDLGWLSRGRDQDMSGLLDMSDHGSFVAALAAKNQRWIDGAQGLSRHVVAGLLRWSGEQMDIYYAGARSRLGSRKKLAP